MIRRALGALCLAAALLWGQAAHAVTIPQNAKNDFTVASTSLVVTFTTGIAAGSMIACAGSYDALATDTLTVTDGSGDSFTSIIAPATITGETFAKVWAGAFLAPTTGVTTVTSSFAGGSNPGFGDTYCFEIDGLTSPVNDQHPTAGGNAATATVSTGTLATAVEAAVAYCTSGNSCTLVAGGGWTDDGQTAHTGSDGDQQVTAATTALSISWNQGAAAQFGTLILTFQSGGAAPAAPPMRMLMGVGQ